MIDHSFVGAVEHTDAKPVYFTGVLMIRQDGDPEYEMPYQCEHEHEIPEDAVWCVEKNLANSHLRRAIREGRPGGPPVV